MPADLRTIGPLVAAVVAGVAHLLVGYVYLISGLVVPFYALLPLWAWWIFLVVTLVRLAIRGSWWVLAVPAVAAVTWIVVVLGGGELLNWTA
jgi:hypothetical protein